MPGFGKDGRGQILYQEVKVAPGACSAGACLLLDNYDITEDFRLIKTQVAMCWAAALTAGEGEGIVLLLYDGELSLAELAECVTADPVDRNDNKELEMSHRLCHLLGSFQDHLNDATRARLSRDLPFEVEPRWTFSAPEGWSLGIYCQRALTTGSTFRFLLKHYGVWVT